MTYQAPTPRKTIRINPALDRGCALPGVFLSHDLQPDALSDAEAVRIPQRPDARRKFLKAWARKNSRRIAQGLGVISLIVPMAGMAAAQEGPVAAESIAGVVDVALQDDGSVIITLADGRQLRIGRDNISVGDDGAILLSGPAAEAVMVAAAEISPTDGGDSFAALGAGAGGLALLAAAAGGGGGDGGGGGTTPDPVELGFAVDGYLSGATVYGDANGNRVLDAGEIQTVTGSDGSFNTAIFPDDVPLVTIGGIDISTGETFTGTLTAPAGSTNITPLTTLVQKLVADTAGTDTPISVADATASVASSLGLEGDAAELLTVDPAALAESGDTTQLQAAAKVAAVINLVTAAAPGDQAAVDSVLSALTADLTDGGEDPFTSATAIEAALTAAGDGIQVNPTDLANVIADVATEIDTAEDLATLEQVQTAVQGDLTEAVTTSVGDTSETSALATTVVTETIATTVGLRPVITGSTSLSDPVAEGTAITISGTGRAGSTVVVELGEATRATAVDETGAWSVDFSGASYLAAGEAEGTVTVVATATADGVTSSAALGAPSYQIDALPPVAPAFDIADATIDAAGIAAVEISGTAEPDTTVRLESTLFAAPIEVSVDGEGVWTTGALDLSAAGDDSYTITATSTDAAGNTSPAATADRVVDASAPAAPAFDIADATIDAAGIASVVISGTAEPDTTVQLESTLFAAPIEVSVDDEGVWTTAALDLSAAGDDSYTITATSTDAAGNTSPTATADRVVDASAPAAPTIDVVAGDNFVGLADVTNDTYTITGTTEAGTSVEVNVDGTVGQADVSGTMWSFDIAVTPGTEFSQNTIIAVATDAAGNASSASPTVQVNVDLDIPPAPAFDIADATIDAAGIAAVEISGTAEPNTTVRLESTLFAAPIEVLVDDEGVWTTAALDLSAAGDDSYTITATSTDAAGNTSPTATADRVVDACAPAAPTIDVVAGDNFVGLAEVTNDAYTITGTTEAGTSVAVSVDGTVGQADVSGTMWSYAIAVTPGTEFSQNTIFAVATDAAGNASPASATVQVNVDLDIPPQPIFDALDGTIDAAGITSVVISGSGEPNTTVVLESTLFANPVEVAVDANSQWTTDPLDLTDATDAVYTITATSMDAAGNTSPSATAERVVDVVPDGTAVITVFDDTTSEAYTVDTLVVYDNEELTLIGDNGLNEFLPGTITGVPENTQMTLTIKDGSGADLAGPFTAQTDASGNFEFAVADTVFEGLDPMTQAAVVTVSGGGASFGFQVIVNSGLGDPASGQFLAGGAVIEPFTDIGVFGAEGATTRTILEGQEMTNGQTVVIAEIIDTADTDSEQYTAILVYDGETSAPIRSFAFDGGAGADVTARTTKIDVRADGLVLTQLNVVDDGNGNLSQGDPLFTVYNIPAASVAAAIPDGSGTEVNINTGAAGVTSTPITLADFGGVLPEGEFYDLDFLADAPGNPVFIAVRDTIAEGNSVTAAVIGTIDTANGEVTTREIATTDVAPFGDYDRAAVFDLIETDIDGNYVSLTLSAADEGDGFTRTQTYDFATEKFTGGTLGIDNNRDLMVATEFREVLDGGDQNIGTDDDVIIVGNQTADAGIVQLNVTGGVATLAISTQALLSFFDGVPDVGTEPILVQFDLFVAGSVAPDLGTLTGGTYTAADPAGALSAYSTGIETTRITLDIDLQGLRALATPPETLDLASVDVGGTDGSTFYGLGVGFVEGVDPVFDGFERVGGVEDFGRKTVVLENSQGRGGFDIVSGFDSSNDDASKQDLLVIEADFGNFRGDGIATVGESPVTLGSDTGIVIFEGVTEDDDLAVIARADAANLGLAQDESIIVVTANEDEAALWTLTFDGTDYQSDSFGRLTGVTSDDLASFTDDGFTNIALQLPLV
ncbi:beta strand repeat-containing protein [Pseudogemmobacter sp. W21_MBD1_M6]|uniref:beta strand repeat-containing protein n=1 Tax=Pseudogemmobacter sp. W21_MBD1_M6 TaxID=3240271 RepID=UPI003F999A21